LCITAPTDWSPADYARSFICDMRAAAAAQGTVDICFQQQPIGAGRDVIM
jgi:hypothetical protein